MYYMHTMDRMCTTVGGKGGKEGGGSKDGNETVEGNGRSSERGGKRDGGRRDKFEFN